MGKFTHLRFDLFWVIFSEILFADGLDGWGVGIFILGLWEYLSIVCLEWFWGSVLMEATGGR